ncbi:MAG: CorA family divalent cation transporter [Bryobacteraceae bacterium]|jgi:magnesium transporter
MEWHDIQNSDDKLLDDLAARYSLHPLHVEDCRQDAQRTKAETSDSYLFISLKQLAFDDAGRLSRRRGLVRWSRLSTDGPSHPGAAA